MRYTNTTSHFSCHNIFISYILDHKNITLWLYVWWLFTKDQRSRRKHQLACLNFLRHLPASARFWDSFVGAAKKAIASGRPTNHLGAPPSHFGNFLFGCKFARGNLFNFRRKSFLISHRQSISGERIYGRQRRSRSPGVRSKPSSGRSRASCSTSLSMKGYTSFWPNMNNFAEFIVLPDPTTPIYMHNAGSFHCVKLFIRGYL